MKVGFIGGGNMASAMIGGMIQKGVVSADDILVSVRTEKSVERLNNQFGVQATMENEAVVAKPKIKHKITKLMKAAPPSMNFCFKAAWKEVLSICDSSSNTVGSVVSSSS